jgi:uncharacterized protein YggE
VSLIRIFASIAIAAALAVPAYAQAVPAIPTIAVTGHGEVTAAPDTAFITSGVTSQAATAREALDANTAAMTQLIAELKGSGIEERDIQTSNFSVNPNYVYTDRTDANGYQLPPRIVGYSVTNTVTVRVRKLDILGSVLDKSVSVGANTINGISFSVEDPSALYDEARREALRDATHKAGLYADEAKVTLGAIAAISESQGFNPPPQPYLAAMSARAEKAPVPIQAGELTFSIDVSVTWQIGQ